MLWASLDKLHSFFFFFLFDRVGPVDNRPSTNYAYAMPMLRETWPCLPRHKETMTIDNKYIYKKITKQGRSVVTEPVIATPL